MCIRWIDHLNIYLVTSILDLTSFQPVSIISCWLNSNVLFQYQVVFLWRLRLFSLFVPNKLLNSTWTLFIHKLILYANFYFFSCGIILSALKYLHYIFPRLGLMTFWIGRFLSTFSINKKKYNKMLIHKFLQRIKCFCLNFWVCLRCYLVNWKNNVFR